MRLPGEPRSAKLTATLLLALGVSLFAVMDGMGKYLTADYPVIQIVWARYIFGAPIVLALAGPAAWPRLLATSRPAMQILRALMPLAASLFVVAGLATLPLADFTAIAFAAPLLVVALSAPMLKETVSAKSWIGVLIGFAGILLIARPDTSAIAFAALFPLATALCFAFYQLLTRVVSRDDGALVSVTWMMIVGLVLLTAVLPWFWRPVAPMDWLLLVVTGVLFGTAHVLVTRAFAMAPAAVLAPISYFQIIAAIAFGFAVFGDMPDIWTILGTIVIVGAGLYVLERRAV